MKKLKEKRETIAVLIEEAESFLELGDLVIGQLIGHLCSEREKISEKIKTVRNALNQRG